MLRESVCLPFVCLILTRFQSRSAQICKRLAVSRRFTENMSTSPYFTTPVVWPAVPSPLRVLASIYDYVHFVSRGGVFAGVCVP